MNKKITISVVMATYNGETYLTEQIDSILQQKKQPIEIIVIDDCSTDKTWEILSLYSKRDNNIKIYKNKQNIGVNGTFLAALKKATGDLIFIADQDDIWLTDKIEKMYKAWDGSNLICSDAIIVDKNKNILHKSELEYFKMNKEISMINPFYFIFSNSISGHNVALTKRFLEDVTPFPEKIMYDQWLAIVAHYNTTLQIVQDPLCLHRMHDNNTNNSVDRNNDKKKHSHSKSILEKKEKIYNQHEPLRQAMRYVSNKNGKEFVSLANKFIEHQQKLDNTIFNFPLFLSLYKLRKILFPNNTSWGQIKTIRNLSVGIKGFWLKI